MSDTQAPPPSFLPRSRFAELLQALTGAGYRCIGPQVRDGAIVYDTLAGVDALPRGVNDQQGPGSYRLQTNGGERWFAWANGPEALRPLLFAPREPLWRVQRDRHGALQFEQTLPAAEKLAVLGVRACDLAGLRLQDAHFLEGADPHYGVRRRDLLLVAVNCTHPAATCFCASTGDGPEVQGGADLVLSELDDGFVVNTASGEAAALMDGLQLAVASNAQVSAARAEVERAGQQMRALPSRNLRDSLFANLDHARWDEVAKRCLACGNCTLVCPTCFCHRQVEHAELGGGESEHVREWDSCFTEGHSYIHGFVVRPEIKHRYRQWLTHKLGGWHDQYGRSGCVGCGRCITWCPVGIDITEEAAAICGGGDGS